MPTWYTIHVNIGLHRCAPRNSHPFCTLPSSDRFSPQHSNPPTLPNTPALQNYPFVFNNFRRPSSSNPFAFNSLHRCPGVYPLPLQISLARHRDEKHVATTPLDSAFTNRDAHKSFRIRFYKKQGGVTTLSDSLSFCSFAKECIPNLLPSGGSALFLKTAGVWGYSSHSGTRLKIGHYKKRGSAARWPTLKGRTCSS
jgi:hypothetical protein